MRLEQLPVAMETFGAKPEDPVETCKRLAAQADALVVIVAHRYGWVPSVAEGGDGKKSITWLEVEAAGDRPVFAFLVDPAADWNQPRESDQLADVGPGDALKVYAAVQALKEFKILLGRRVRDQFLRPTTCKPRSRSAWLHGLSNR